MRGIYKVVALEIERRNTLTKYGQFSGSVKGLYELRQTGTVQFFIFFQTVFTCSTWLLLCHPYSVAESHLAVVNAAISLCLQFRL